MAAESKIYNEYSIMTKGEVAFCTGRRAFVLACVAAMC